MTAIIVFIAVIFSAYCLRSAWRKYVGYNPTAPSLWARIKNAIFKPRHNVLYGFRKMDSFQTHCHNAIFDPHPEQDESHSSTRYDR